MVLALRPKKKAMILFCKPPPSAPHAVTSSCHQQHGLTHLQATAPSTWRPRGFRNLTVGMYPASGQFWACLWT